MTRTSKLSSTPFLEMCKALLSQALCFVRHNYRLLTRKKAPQKVIQKRPGLKGSSFCNLLITIIIFCVCGCSNQTDIGDMPHVLKIGVLPDENKEILLKRYTPLFKYLSDELGIPYEFKTSENYADFLKKFDQKEIDLAYFGGVTFTQAFHKSNATPLVMRDVDVNFTSYFFSKADRQLTRIEDFKNKTFAFGSKLSTSGHLMPRFFLKEKEITPETFFSNVKYSGSHDKTAMWVKDGVVDIGVANSKIIDKLIQDGSLAQSDIYIIWETPPYPDYVWAIQPGFGQSTRIKIRNAFMSLSPSNKKQAAILAGMDAGGFLPASPRDFATLDRIIKQSKLLNEDN